MVLKDLIGPAPTPAAERPPGITCEKYTRGEGKRCIHDAANGACALPDEFVGVEWLKANGPKHTHSVPVVTEPPKPAPPARDLFGNTVPEVASTPATPNPATPPAPTTSATVAVDIDQLLGLCIFSPRPSCCAHRSDDTEAI